MLFISTSAFFIRQYGKRNAKSMLLWKINKPIFIVVLSETSSQVYKTLSGITTTKHCFWAQNWLNLWSYDGPWAPFRWCRHIKNNYGPNTRNNNFAALPRIHLQYWGMVSFTSLGTPLNWCGNSSFIEFWTVQTGRFFTFLHSSWRKHSPIKRFTPTIAYSLWNHRPPPSTRK